MKQLILNITRHSHFGRYCYGILLSVILFSTPGHGAVPSNTDSDNASKITSHKKTLSDKKAVKPAPKEMVFQEGKLTTRITAKPLNKVMEKFSRFTGIKIEWQDQEIEKLISSGITDRPLDEAVKNILHGESYLLFYASVEEGENLSRILILSRDEERDEVAMDMIIEEYKAQNLEIAETDTIGLMNTIPPFIFEEDKDQSEEFEELIIGLEDQPVGEFPPDLPMIVSPW